MGWISRSEGKKAFGWVHEESGYVYQEFVFEKVEQAERYFPEGCKPCEVQYVNDVWVEYREEN